VGTNDQILIVVCLFFGCMLLSIHHEEKRKADRRQRHLGPPDGIERRSGRDQRSRSPLASLRWILGAPFRALRGKGGKK